MELIYANILNPGYVKSQTKDMTYHMMGEGNKVINILLSCSYFCKICINLENIIYGQKSKLPCLNFSCSYCKSKMFLITAKIYLYGE